MTEESKKAGEPKKGEEAKKADETKKKGDYNIFISNVVYPDPHAIFSYQPKSLPDIKDDCYIVLDTNALLVPYSIGQESLDQIRRVYSTLAARKVLVVPGQVAREFAKNRPKKLAEIYQQLSVKRNISQLQKGKYPLLDGMEEYENLVKLEKEIDKLIKDYRDNIGKLLDHIKNWTWDDPVSRLYKDMFGKDSVVDIAIDEAKIKADLASRQTHKLPPGYKDSSKDDDGVGDLLIWYTILELGKSKDVLFVSGDTKPDWWHQSEKQNLYLRHELVDEFRRVSGDKTLHVIAFSGFLDLYGVEESVVEEVKRKESQSIFELIRSLPSEGTRATAAVYYWLTSRYPDKEIIPGSEGSGIDYLTEDHAGNLIAIEVLLSPRALSQVHFKRARDKVTHGGQLVDNGDVSRFHIIIVFDNMDMTLSNMKNYFRISDPRVAFTFGYISSEGEFIEVPH